MHSIAAWRFPICCNCVFYTKTIRLVSGQLRNVSPKKGMKKACGTPPLAAPLTSSLRAGSYTYTHVRLRKCTPAEETATGSGVFAPYLKQISMSRQNSLLFFIYQLLNGVSFSDNFRGRSQRSGWKIPSHSGRISLHRRRFRLRCRERNRSIPYIFRSFPHRRRFPVLPATSHVRFPEAMPASFANFPALLHVCERSNRFEHFIYSEKSARIRRLR